MLPLTHSVDSKLTQESKVHQARDKRRSEWEEDLGVVFRLQESGNAQGLAAARGSQSDHDGQRGLHGEVGREDFGLEGCELGPRKGAEGDDARDKALQSF